MKFKEIYETPFTHRIYVEDISGKIYAWVVESPTHYVPLKISKNGLTVCTSFLRTIAKSYIYSNGHEFAPDTNESEREEV